MPDSEEWRLDVAATLGRIEAKLEVGLEDHDRRLESLEAANREVANIPERVDVIEKDLKFHSRMKYVHTLIIVPLMAALHLIMRKLGVDI